MSGVTLAVLIILLMFALMAIRTPIAIAMFISGSVGYVLQTGWTPYANFMNSMAFARFASYDLSVIPLFILMGQFATRGGISKSLFEFTAAVNSNSDLLMPPRVANWPIRMNSGITDRS